MHITLITDVLPDDEFTAGQVLNRIFRRLHGTAVDVLWINQSRLRQAPDTHTFRPGREYRFELPHWLGAPLHRLVTRIGQPSRPALALQTVITFWLCVRIAASIIRIRRGQRRRHDNDVLWLVLQGEKLLFVYWLVSWFEKNRIILHQWDPLSWWMGHRGHRPEVIRFMTRLLTQVEARAWLNLVPSIPWVDKLTAVGRSVHRVDNFFSRAELTPAPAIRLRTPGRINLAFMGQLYADAELKSCLLLLGQCARRLHRKLTIHYFGADTCRLSPDIEVISYGYRPRGEAITMMSKWDAALLPYPADEKFEETARLSFPSKARAYLAAGLPIVANAPAASSVERFFREFYRPYFFNAALDENAAEFLAQFIDEPLDAWRLRNQHAMALIREWFSEEAELVPLAHALQRGIGA
jgi:hypothetical protein